MIKHIIIITILSLNILSLNAQDFKSNKNKINRTLELINTQYVEEADFDKLSVEAIKAMLKVLDPHSKYLSKESLQKSRESLIGSFGGVGIHYQILDDTLFIIKAVENGPASNAGIKSGDKLIAIDGFACTGDSISNTYFSEKLRGNEGEKVNLKIIRHNDKKVYDFEIERGSIPIISVIAAFMLDKNVGYIKLNRFANTSIQEFNQKVFELKMQGMKTLILDLRNNSGGLMMSAIQMVDEFVDEDKLIVYTEGHNYPKKEYKSTANGNLLKDNIIVLVNEYSASASEIVAGGLQDLDRGIIVGRRTYGKGLVGRNFGLPDGSGVRLTTGKYYTPSGRCIQKNYENGIEDYQNELNERLKHGEFYNQDSINFPDSLKYKTLSNRTVFGGGGIMPDIFIPADSSQIYNEFYKQIVKNGAVNIYSVYYLDRYFEDLKDKYPNYKSFKKNFVFDDSIRDDFMNYIKKHYQIESDYEQYYESEIYIKTRFKAILARNLFDGSDYFQESLIIDDELLKTLEIAKRKSTFKMLDFKQN